MSYFPVLKLNDSSLNWNWYAKLKLRTGTEVERDPAINDFKRANDKLDALAKRAQTVRNNTGTLRLASMNDGDYFQRYMRPIRDNLTIARQVMAAGSVGSLELQHLAAQQQPGNHHMDVNDGGGGPEHFFDANNHREPPYRGPTDSDPDHDLGEPANDGDDASSVSGGSEASDVAGDAQHPTQPRHRAHRAAASAGARRQVARYIRRTVVAAAGHDEPQAAPPAAPQEPASAHDQPAGEPHAHQEPEPTLPAQAARARTTSTAFREPHIPAPQSHININEPDVKLRVMRNGEHYRFVVDGQPLPRVTKNNRIKIAQAIDKALASPNVTEPLKAALRKHKAALDEYGAWVRDTFRQRRQAMAARREARMAELQSTVL